MNRKTKKVGISMIFLIGIVETILIILSMISAVLIASSYSNSIKEDNKEYIRYTLENYESILYDSLSSFSSYCYASSNSTNVKLLMGGYYDIIGEEYQKIVAINDVQNSLNSMISFNQAAEMAAILIKNDNYGDIFISSTSLEQTKTFLLNSLNNMQYSFDNIVKNIDGNIYFTYMLNSTYNVRYIIKIDNNYIENMITKVGTLSNKNFSMKYNSDNNIEFVTSNFILNENEYRNIRNKFEINEGVIDGNYVMAKYEYFDCFSIYVIYNMTEQMNSTLVPMILIIIIIVIGEIFISVLLTNNFAGKPMRRLLLAMKQVEEGNFDNEIKEKSLTDFQQIYDGYNKMILSLKEYIDESYIQQLQLKESEFKVLQSQINPHFLYNCFANISSLCQSGDGNKASIFTSKLAKYYYYITQDNSIVCVKDEYEHMIKYLEIQKIRFGDRVNYELDNLNEELANYHIPKLLFQPIVENSFKYVFSKVSSNGIMRVKISENERYFYIKFEDNGSDIDEKKLHTLQENIKNSSLIGKHGLSNISRRLEYISKNTSFVKLEKNNSNGLVVTICLNKENKL